MTGTKIAAASTQGVRALRMGGRWRAIVGMPVLLLAVVLIAGCADYRAIADFAKTSQATVSSGGYSAVVEAYRFYPDRIRPLVNSAGQQKLDEAAKSRAEQTQQLLQLNMVVSEYLGALAKLAGDEVVVSSAQTKQLADAATSAGLLGTGQEAQAARALASLLVRAGTDRWRQAELARMIGTAQDPLLEVIGHIRSVIGPVAAGDDGDEIRLIKAKVDEVTLVPVRADPAERFLMAEWQRDRLQAVKARGPQRTALLEAYAKISRGHTALYENRDHLNIENVVTQIRGYESDLRALLPLIASGLQP